MPGTGPLAFSPELPHRAIQGTRGGRVAPPPTVLAHLPASGAPRRPSEALGALCGAYRAQAQKGDPSDMQSVAGRRSEAGEVCHSGAWREDRRKVRRS